ncbi:hypothetical protein Scep_003981 [Stephania cephalantha]|uniref:R13L1/DRL21-like LRR repeat region domain-containing protein n=1 Tax=Stephania cephalantha TaxID=152367 RepID=A0AAP0KRK1_9MAGN
MEVLESLQPHKNLKELRIRKYSGRIFPSCLGSSLYSLGVFTCWSAETVIFFQAYPPANAQRREKKEMGKEKRETTERARTGRGERDPAASQQHGGEIDGRPAVQQLRGAAVAVGDCAARGAATWQQRLREPAAVRWTSSDAATAVIAQGSGGTAAPTRRSADRDAGEETRTVAAVLQAAQPAGVMADSGGGAKVRLAQRGDAGSNSSKRANGSGGDTTRFWRGTAASGWRRRRPESGGGRRRASGSDAVAATTR